jgi:uncharacterized protein (TIRG00374 family)
VRAIWLGLGVALAAASLLPLAFGDTDVVREALAFPVAGMASVFAIVVASWMAKALKFQLLARHLHQRASFMHCLAVSLGCDFAFVASPAGIAGYPATVVLFGRLGAGAACAMAIAAADQILDLVFFGIAIPLSLIGLLVQNLPTIPSANAVAGTAVAVALIATCTVAFGRKRLPELAHRLSRFVTTRLGRIAAIRRQCVQFRRHLRQLGAAPAGFLVRVALATAVQWLTRYSILGVVLAWLGYPIPFMPMFLAQSVALHAGQWTGIPGGFGATDGLLLESLRAWVQVAPLATALIVWRVTTFHLTIAAGGAAFVLLVARKNPLQDHPSRNVAHASASVGRGIAPALRGLVRILSS